MIRLLYIISCILPVFGLNAQSQLGLSIEASKIQLDSPYLKADSNLGLGFGFLAISGIHRTGDLLIDINVAKTTTTLFANPIEDNQSYDFNLHQIHANFLYQRYIIIPNGYKPHLGVRAGAAFSFITGWNNNDELPYDTTFGTANYNVSDFNNLSPFSLGAIIGIEGGFEQIRIALNYHQTTSNFLKREIGSSDHDISFKPNRIILSVSYLFDKFY